MTLRKRRRVEEMKFENTEWSPDYWADQLTVLLAEVFDMEEQTYDTNVWEACWIIFTSRIHNRVTGLSQWEEPQLCNWGLEKEIY